MTQQYWAGTVNDVDDFGYSIDGTFIDGATQFGPWAIMTPKAHRMYGRGLGTGKGQEYRQQPDGRWMKIK